MTGSQPSLCCYSNCRRRAVVGGHIWIAGHDGPVIVPICNQCNYHENATGTRMQGSRSALRAGTIVVQTEYTASMANAPRRIAETCHLAARRSCEACGDDISGQPEYHTRCLRCFRNGNHFCRSCEQCGSDISDRPDHHFQCLGCYHRHNQDDRFSDNDSEEDSEDDSDDLSEDDSDYDY